MPLIALLHRIVIELYLIHQLVWISLMWWDDDPVFKNAGKYGVDGSLIDNEVEEVSGPLLDDRALETMGSVRPPLDGLLPHDAARSSLDRPQPLDSPPVHAKEARSPPSGHRWII
ncbi:hypothetical protein Scep_004140 [Stephania cephalantha]|uniref:Uncharacterized protein n=1 Tax=Stephania cephalantha TaxID=152367 RepID=A0AAP0KRW4_9MAGN